MKRTGSAGILAVSRHEVQLRTAACDRSALWTAATSLVRQENRIANKKTDDLGSRNGHIVVRVDPGGATFNVPILSFQDETHRLLTTFGPYTS